jgi:hypothetical protein
VKLTFGQVTDLLVRLYGVDPSKRDPLVARLKYHQREGFPPNVEPGRGPRPAYGLEATFMLVFTFELSRLRIPSGEAARIVVANWRTFQRMLLIGWAAHLEGRPPGSRARSDDVLDDPFSADARMPSLDDGPYYAAILPDGLEDLRRPDREAGSPDEVRLIDQRTFWSWFRTPGAAPETAIHFLDFERIVADALAALVDEGRVVRADVDAGFQSLLDQAYA